jgi:DUF1365 family protein
MGEFLEYLRHKHFPDSSFVPKRRLKPRAEVLADDSVSEITDLDKKDILASSMHLLSKKEKALLKETTREFKNL